MIFTDPLFFLFFAVVFSLYWLIRWNSVRKLFLLCSSYAFYAVWDWRFLSLIIISTLVDYSIGMPMQRSSSGSHRRLLVITSLLVNLGILGVFKYYNFFVESLQRLCGLLGVHVSTMTLEIVLPIGISFYTFQTLSYTIDLYRKKIEVERSLLNFALFVSFFPQLIAGPIVRAADFLPQLKKKKMWGEIDFRPLLVLFLVGFFKKACISDNIAPAVDKFFASPASFDAVSCWIATLLYSVQIYCDFSGYSDMAIACAGLLGYKLCVNFSYPYFAVNIREFWRRWHISLSTWLRDYLYISLGGGRGGRWKTARNIMVTMLLGGLWHGAAVNFIIWGGLHGIALLAQRVFSSIFSSSFPGNFFSNFVSRLATLYWLCLTWIFFRSETLEGAVATTKMFVLFSSSGVESLSHGFIVILLALLVLHGLSKFLHSTRFMYRISSVTFAVLYGIVFALVTSMMSIEYKPFIYFQF